MCVFTLVSVNKGNSSLKKFKTILVKKLSAKLGFCDL